MNKIPIGTKVKQRYNNNILSKTAKTIFFACKSWLILSTAIALVFISSAIAANSTDKYGEEYFHAIEGEVSGQTAPGVEAVYINGKHVTVNDDLSYSALVALEEGQKYLTIETRYQDMSYTKKYLVARHPDSTKGFKILIPKKDLKKMDKAKSKKPSKPKKKRQVRKKRIVKPKKIWKPLPPKEKWLGFEFAAEIEPGKFLIVREIDGKFFAAMSLSKSNAWIPLDKISHAEFKELLEKGTIPSSLAPKIKEG